MLEWEWIVIEGWQGPSCDQAYRYQPLRGREAKEGGGSLASLPYLPCLSFQGYLLGSLGLMVLGGWYNIYFSMKSFFLGAKEEYMVDMDCMCFSWLFFFYAGSFIFVYLFC